MSTYSKPQGMFTIGVTAGLAWELPYRNTVLYGKPAEVYHRRSRRELYRKVELMLRTWVRKVDKGKEAGKDRVSSSHSVWVTDDRACMRAKRNITWIIPTIRKWRRQLIFGARRGKIWIAIATITTYFAVRQENRIFHFILLRVWVYFILLYWSDLPSSSSGRSWWKNGNSIERERRARLIVRFLFQRLAGLVRCFPVRAKKNLREPLLESCLLICVAENASQSETPLV